MKRRRDDINASSASPSVSSSRGKSYVGSDVGMPTALSYVKDVKQVFQDQRDKIDTFFVILKDFGAKRTDLRGSIARVKELFKGHNNLISGFNIFLPEGFEITIDEEKAVKEPLLNLPCQFKPPLSSSSFSCESSRSGLTMIDVVSYVKYVKKVFQDQTDKVDMLLVILSDFRHHRTDLRGVVARVKVLFKGHNNLISGFNIFLPEELEIPLYEEDEDDDDTHTVFNRSQAQRYDDPGSVPPPPPPVVAVDKDPQPVASRGDSDHSVDLNVDTALKHIEPRKGVEKENRERRSRGLDVDGEAEEEQGVLPKKRTSSESFEAYNSGPAASHYEENNLKESLSKEERLSSPNNGEEKEREAAKEKEERSKDKYMGKYIHDLDLSDSLRCTPSYRLLPSDYPLPSVRHRETSEAVFLNDHWVSVNSASEGYSSKHMRRNKYEESLFKCEDDRFELDMLLESAGSAAKRGQELLNSITEKKRSLEEGSFVVEDHFTALNLRCIERLYGDHGVDVKETIRKNPAAALPVILTRLKQKQDEWKKCREDLNLVWADVYARYHYKSLDHRSFSFKQQDSKKLSAKVLVSEIKDLKDKSQKEDDVPQLEYEYLDRSIHEDVFKLIQFSCEEIYSNKEKMGKVVRLWNSFLELMLAVPPPRSKGSDSVEHHGASTTTRVFYGNEDFYVLFRLHRILYERILSAKTYCTGGGELNLKDTAASPHLYARFMSALFSLLNGSVENYEFEDECRAIIGNQSYVLFTLDKLLYSLVKQLQAVVTNDMDNKLLQLYGHEKPDTVYYENARNLLHDENIYRLECSSSPTRLSIQLMDSCIKEKPGASLDPLFARSHPPQKKFLSNSLEVPPQAIMLQR